MIINFMTYLDGRIEGCLYTCCEMRGKKMSKFKFREYVNLISEFSIHVLEHAYLNTQKVLEMSFWNGKSYKARFKNIVHLHQEKSIGSFGHLDNNHILI